MPSRGALASAVLALAVLAVIVFRVVPDFLGTDGNTATGGDHITHTSGGGGGGGGDELTDEERRAAYVANLAFLTASPFRNTNHDDSPYRDVPSAQLVIEEHLGPRTDYLGNPGGNAEQSFPLPEGGQFRAGCEFSHFAYDDPLLLPDRPGESHLHMFFGNTDVNAFSTYETLIDSGSSTCNGQELNRTGYWVPAMFDGQGNVRVPERVVVYYKGEGESRGAAVPYPERAAMIALQDLNNVPNDRGGAVGKFSFVCSDQWSGAQEPGSNTMPDCSGSRFLDELGVEDEPHVVLEMNVKFPQCWNGEDPSNWRQNFQIPEVGGWYFSECGGDFDSNLPNLEYFVNYRVDIGESTRDWFLASDVDAVTFTRSGPGGQSIHGDWWGGWNEEVNRQWIENCVNHSVDPVPSGCGFGYLTDGGPDPANPIEGPALRYRPQYTGPQRIPAGELFEQLCAPFTEREFARAEDAAHCLPGT